MSLSNAELQATSNELHQNFELAGLTPDEICADLGISRGGLDEILQVAPAKPEDVWMLRDYLELAVTDRGLTPAPYSALTPSMRSQAARWFPLHPPVRPTRP
jgi:hypothetical protein